MAQSRKRLKTAHDSNSDVVLGETPLLSLGDDLLIGICIHLQSNDLASISSTCKHFGEKLEQYNNEHSLMEFIGKQIVEDYASAEEKLLLQQQEESNGILLYDRLLMLRNDLLFEQLIGQGLEYVGTNKARVLLPVITGTAMHTMISNKVTTALSGGKHYAKFTVHGGGEHCYVGLIRNIKNWDRKSLKKFSPFAPKHRKKLLAEKNDSWGSSGTHCCGIRVRSGQVYSTSWSASEPSYLGAGGGWAGMNSYQSDGSTTTFTLCLDADNGTLSVSQNGNFSIIKAGLTGSYCWMVNFWGICGLEQEVEIEMGTPPSA